MLGGDGEPPVAGGKQIEAERPWVTVRFLWGLLHWSEGWFIHSANFLEMAELVRP